MKLHIFASGLLLAVSFTACSGEKKETTEKEGVETVLPSLPNEVTVMPLKKQVFNHELISNGKVTGIMPTCIFVPRKWWRISG